MNENNEIEILQVWEWVWWDKLNDAEFTTAVTGTPWNPNPTQDLQRRYVRCGERKVHAMDGGLVEAKWSTRWEGSKSFTTFWDECTVCGKKFDRWEY